MKRFDIVIGKNEVVDGHGSISMAIRFLSCSRKPMPNANDKREQTNQSCEERLDIVTENCGMDGWPWK